MWIMNTGQCTTILLAVLVSFSCSRMRNEPEAIRLQQWDLLCDSVPEAISDSLNTMSSRGLSPDNRAWHGLLRTITDDKIHAPFTTDSLINSVEHYFHHHEQGARNHVRSLIYQGIVRVRLGVTDSTSYEPLKKALTLLQMQKEPDDALLYLSNYYLGHLHRVNDNNETAHHYFQQALAYAKRNNNASHLFGVYLKLFWLQMSGNKYDDAYLYLDTLATYASTSENTYYLLNAQSVYFENKGKYREALESEKEQLLLIDSLQRKPEYFRIFYSLSDRYFNLNQLDSALHYAHQAVTHIEDSTYRLNYLLYQNVAEVAAAMNNYRMANDFHRQALESYSISVDDRLNTQIQELEQRYELSEYENRTLKAETRFSFILTLSAFSILFTITLFLYFRKQRVIARLKHAKLTEEKRHLEWEKREAEVKTKLLHERDELQQLLLSRYDLFLQFHTDQHQQFVRMRDKIRSKQPELGDAYDKMLKTGQKQFTHLVGELFTVDEIERLFNVVVDKNTFNESDRLLLFMLSTHATNEQIAAMLNTTTHNLKTRKTYLKNKIIKKAITDTEFERLLKHF